MRATSKLLALAFTAALQPAMAGTVFLDFEDVAATAPLTTRYNALGVDVAGNAWVETSKACKYGAGQTAGHLNYTRPGSCGAVFLAANPFADDPSDNDSSLTFTLADGFINTLSFVFSSNTGDRNLSFHILDAAGKDLGGQAGLQGAPCNAGVYCNWQTVNLSFSGVARSVVFTASDMSVVLDDLRFTTPAATGQLPEPTSIALVVGALAGLGWARKRAAR